MAFESSRKVGWRADASGAALSIFRERERERKKEREANQNSEFSS